MTFEEGQAVLSPIQFVLVAECRKPEHTGCLCGLIIGFPDGFHGIASAAFVQRRPVETGFVSDCAANFGIANILASFPESFLKRLGQPQPVLARIDRGNDHEAVAWDRKGRRDCRS